MRFPWQSKIEHRSDHADRVAAYILQQISKKSADVSATAAARAVTLFVGRCFANATPEGEEFAQLLTPEILYTIGVRLVTRGETVLLFELVNGQPTLTEASAWDVSGSTTDPNAWRYDIDLPTPDGSLRRRVSGSQILHPRLPSHQPWRGESPLSGLLAADILAGVEAQLAGEADKPSGYLLPFGGSSDHNPDDEDDPLAALAQALADGKGSTLILDTPAERAQGAATASSSPSYPIARYGVNPPDTALSLRHDAAAAIYAAVGIRGILLEGSGDATALRESARLALGTLKAWGNLVSRDAARLFEHDVTLNWHSLNFHDARARSQVVTALKAAELDLSETEILRMAGWEV